MRPHQHRRPRLDRLLDDCRTGLDQPLSPKARHRITELDHTPNCHTWDAAYSLVIGARPVTTLWQAVSLIDPHCPRHLPVTDQNPDRRWRGYHPSRMVLRLALRAAQDRQAA